MTDCVRPGRFAAHGRVPHHLRCEPFGGVGYPSFTQGCRGDSPLVGGNWVHDRPSPRSRGPCRRFQPWRSAGPKILFTHKPLMASQKELASFPQYRFVPSPHVDDLENYFVTSAAAGDQRACSPVPDRKRRSMSTSVGADYLGGSARDRSGHSRCQATWCDVVDTQRRLCGDDWLREPLGLAQFTLGDDIPGPLFSFEIHWGRHQAAGSVRHLSGGPESSSRRRWGRPMRPRRWELGL